MIRDVVYLFEGIRRPKAKGGLEIIVERWRGDLSTCRAAQAGQGNLQWEGSPTLQGPALRPGAGHDALN